MEIPEHIIEKAFELKNMKSLNSELKNVLNKLHTLSIEEILFKDKKNKIDSKIRNIHSRIFLHLLEPNALEVKKVINTLNEFLIDGIEKNNSKSILIFVYANCYFMINPQWFLNQDVVKSLSKRKISKTIFDLLIKINFSTFTRSGVPKHEITLLHNYNTGIIENNIKKVYDFVFALENGGNGFHINYILERFYWFMYYLNNGSFIKIINKLSKPKEFIFLFQSLKEKELIKIMNSKSISNQWAHIELIRQIVEKEDRLGKIDSKLTIAIYNSLIEIKKFNFEFLKQTISFFERSILFNSALGKFMTTISLPELKEIVDETLLIHKYESKKKAKHCLLVHYDKNSTELQLNFLLELVYIKWESFFKVISIDDDFYANDLILTDYCDFIVEYYLLLKSENDVLKLISEYIKYVKEIDSVWVKSLSVQGSHYYQFFSKLYLLSYAFKIKKIKNSQILLDFQYIMSDSIKSHRYFKGENFNEYIDIISKNLNWEKV